MVGEKEVEMVGEGVVGGMVVEVEVIGVVGVLGWLTVWERWRQRPYRSHIGRGLGVERSGGGVAVRGSAGGRRGEVVVGEEVVVVVEEEIVGVEVVVVEEIEVVVVLFGVLLFLLRQQPRWVQMGTGVKKAFACRGDCRRGGLVGVVVERGVGGGCCWPWFCCQWARTKT